MKRGIDLAISAPGLVVTAPIVLVAMALVRLTSIGPAIFSQVRVGRDGEPFACRKLRTMRVGTPALPTHETAATSITAVGRLLRKTKIDELPQLWNVLTGEMSLVGPRPCLPSQTVLVEERRRLGVLTLRPGISGLAQVRGVDMSDPVRLAQIDAEYLRRATIGLDLRILLRTFFGGRGPI